MGEYSEGFVAFDVSKTKHAVAIADGGRGGEARFLGDVSSSPTTVERLIRKLAGRYDKLYFCYEAGPTGYGLYRRIEALGHTCLVVAPALIPKRPGERVKTNRRDAVTLARLHRAGELTGVWVPDAVHEAVRDLIRAREAAADDLRRKRQQLLSLPAAPRPDLQRGWPLDAGASALACQASLRACPADRLSGRHRCDRGCRSTPASPGTAARRYRAELVDGAGGGCLSGDARRLVPGSRVNERLETRSADVWRSAHDCRSRLVRLVFPIA